MARMRKVELVVLCEDVKHKAFMLRYLTSLKFNVRQIRVRLAPPGSGAGEQWVRERYPEYVRSQRRRANHTKASLIAVIDADTSGVEQRRRQLDGALDAAGLSARNAEERIAIVIPRRNVESWVHFAVRREIDETTDFKHRYPAVDACKDAAALAIEVCRTTTDHNHAPPSLVTACGELRRVVQR